MDIYEIGQNLFAYVLVVFYWIYNSIRFFIPYKYRCKSVANEIVLVTGAGNGIGKSLAKKFAKLGSIVVLWDVDENGNKQTLKEILDEGGKAHAYKCDLCKRDEIYKVAEQVKKEVGDITILVNNAGIVNGKPFLELTENAIERTFQVNTFAHFWTLKAFLPAMINKNHGHIVSLCSMASIVGAYKLSDYCSSKAAALALHESLESELRMLDKDGIKTTAVCPNSINTGLFKGFQVKHIPTMETEEATDKIMEAVLTNQRLLLMPRIMYYFALTKFLYPRQAIEYMIKIMEADKMMSNFVGRKKEA